MSTLGFIFTVTALGLVAGVFIVLIGFSILLFAKMLKEKKNIEAFLVLAFFLITVAMTIMTAIAIRKLIIDYKDSCKVVEVEKEVAKNTFYL